MDKTIIAKLVRNKANNQYTISLPKKKLGFLEDEPKSVEVTIKRWFK